VSALRTRLERLEERLGPCPQCARHRRSIELVGPQHATSAQASQGRVCGSCGETAEPLLVLVAFEPAET